MTEQTKRRKYTHGDGRPNKGDDIWQHLIRGGPDDHWDTECRKNRDGRPRANVRSTTTKTGWTEKFAYVLIFEQWYGTKVHAGTCVCHTCDIPWCCNPAHLFLGTQADNVADMVAKGRQARGEGNGNSKLSDATVDSIREMLATGLYLQREIGQMVGCSGRHVSDIKNGKTRAKGTGGAAYDAARSNPEATA